ncbi:MAG: Rap1a/Tai family immunity protein [Xanthobacteraceae bacterium]
MRDKLLGISLCFLASAANAEVTGNNLKEYCGLYPQHAEATALCMGYISGALDTMRGYDKMLKLNLACEPSQVTGEQLIAMTIKYLSDHPEKLHFTASSLILDMYTKAFPCPKN